MSLRRKLILLLGLATGVAVFVSSLSVYMIARHHLQKSAASRLEQIVAMAVGRIEERFLRLQKIVEVWAKSPIVKNAVRHPEDRELILRLNRFFMDMVESDPILQTYNLLDDKAACIASSIPERIGLAEMQEVVSQKDDFLTAMTGKPVIKGSFMAISTGRPIVSIAVPVFLDGKVKGVVRPIVDMADFNRHDLKPMDLGEKINLFVFNPYLDLDKYAGHNFTLVIKTPYQPPDISSLASMLDTQSGVVSYYREGIKRYAAFHWTRNPRWLLVAEQPMDDILQPIRHTKYTALGIAAILLFFISIPAGLAIKPILASLNDCLFLVREIGKGRLEKRIKVRTRDDMGELGHGLNQMADILQKQRETLKSSEAKFRGIFETAVEGIFQADEWGDIITANPAMAKIAGEKSPMDLIRRNVAELSATPIQGIQIMECLRTNGELSNFDLTLLRMDGGTRYCLMNARAERDENKELSLIHGVISDVTEKRRIEEARARAKNAEKLAAHARFKTLRYQLNPHFLFNVLNTIDALSRKSPDKIPDLLQLLSLYLRHTLRPEAEMMLKLGREAEAVRSYLDIEIIRFQNKLQTLWDLEPKSLEIKVPEMLLQPLIENAVKYGMKTSPMPLRIHIQAKIRENRLLIRVKNSGRWIQPGDLRNRRPGLGLKNLDQRLEMAYGDRFSFTTFQDKSMVHVEIKLPVNSNFISTP